MSLPENLCMSHVGQVREGRRKKIGNSILVCVRNMKLFLLFKYETEIEIDLPSGGQWTLVGAEENVNAWKRN